MPFDLARIGQLLRETREHQGLSYEEISEVLFIRKRVVGAIEAGNWRELPDPVYVRGYVRQYAAFLDIADLLRKEVTSGEADSSGRDAPKKLRKGILRGWQIVRKKEEEAALSAARVPWSVIDQL